MTEDCPSTERPQRADLPPPATVFADIRQFVSLATYNADYDASDEGSSGPANIMDGVTTTNADIWPGGHAVAGWTNGSTVTVVRPPSLPPA
jgi:hypothetical protein